MHILIISSYYIDKQTSNECHMTVTEKQNDKMIKGTGKILQVNIFFKKCHTITRNFGAGFSLGFIAEALIFDGFTARKITGHIPIAIRNTTGS